MPYALASMPHVFVAMTQHVRACENATIGQPGAGGGGGVQVPITMLPQVFVAASQHATGGVFDRPGFGGAATQVTPPQVTVAAGAPAVPAAVPAVAVPVPATPVPATTDVPPLTAAVPVVPAVTVAVPPAAAAPAVTCPLGVVGSSPPHAARTLNSNANQETRAFIL
jgi:hypothetical protein